jgi:hypothetical protein
MIPDTIFLDLKRYCTVKTQSNILNFLPTILQVFSINNCMQEIKIKSLPVHKNACCSNTPNERINHG